MDIALEYFLCVEELPSVPPGLGLLAESCTWKLFVII